MLYVVLTINTKASKVKRMSAVFSRERLIEAIPQALRAMMEARNQLASEPWMQLDLTVKQLKVLFVLGRLGPSRPSAIAAAVGVSAASATGVLDRLVEQGYIARETDAADRRAQLIRLSEAGSKIVGDLYLSGRQQLLDALTEMSDADLRALRRGLDALVDVTRLRVERLAADPASLVVVKVVGQGR